MTWKALIVISLIVLSKAEEEEDTRPKIPQEWIYTMMITGFIGSIVHLTIIFISIRHNRKKKQSKLSQFQTILNFTIWICNLIACAEWSTLRTSLFLPLTTQRCKIFYISNYLFYMIGKYILHILLLYRLYFVFRKTNVRFKKSFIYLVYSIITINFFIFTGAWMDSAINHVVVGVIVPDKTLEICTMFNSDKETVHDADRIWPILLGGQDLIVGLFTLGLFVYKITQFHQNQQGSFYETRIKRLMVVVRKLFVLGTISIISTFIFYTFAIPFYGNLTFLLPIDASINSLCTILLFCYVGNAYTVLCYVCDRCARIVVNAPTGIRELSTHSVDTHTKDVNVTNGTDDYHLHSIEFHCTRNVEEVTNEKNNPDLILENNDASQPTFHSKSQSNVECKHSNSTRIKPMPLVDSREVRSSFF